MLVAESLSHRHSANRWSGESRLAVVSTVQAGNACLNGLRARDAVVSTLESEADRRHSEVIHISEKSPTRGSACDRHLADDQPPVVAKDLPIPRENSPSHRQFTGEVPRSAYLTPMVLGQAH